MLQIGLGTIKAVAAVAWQFSMASQLLTVPHYLTLIINNSGKFPKLQ